MRCMIDANIILDVLSKRNPFYIDSSKIWKLCETRQIEGYVSVLSFADIAYILRKELNADQVCNILNSLKLIFHFVELVPEDLYNAAALKWDDFEDAIQEVCARRIKVDYLVTRNEKDFKKSKLSVKSPPNLLSNI